ncbi:MAG: Omp28-related outer membrane protein [Bacteroidales bacterium]|nr:Omp28-related outer membrane protein [Bacteroidales bacterium]HOY38321.1 Omp28-related outer membrane protein [Bacteroidales bacterium]HQP05135.1 Omp28-related outer membrane protein [Bacteroidales bacterium]
MKKLFIITFCLLASAFFTTCDIIEAPYLDTNEPVWNGRKSLILDFTGHMCGNCPYAHRTIVSMQNNFGEAVVPIAVHCGYFSMLASNDPLQPYHYDFTTDVGLELGGNGFTSYGYFGVQSQPIGVVNHLIPESLKAHDGWGSEIAKYYSSFPELMIHVDKTFNETDSTLIAVVHVESQIESTRNLSLAVYITESHIIQWQTDYSQTDSNVEDYEHNHVLRGSFNGAWGDAINTNNNPITRLQQFEKEYSLKTGLDWVPANLSIIAFVYDTDSKEVLQCEEIHVGE